MAHVEKLPRSVDSEIGARIRQHRKSAGLTQKELGSMLGVNYQVIQKYEKGSTKLSVNRLIVISNHLSIDPRVFVDGLSPSQLVAQSARTVEFHNSNTAIDMSRALSELSPAIQRSIVNMVREIAAGQN